MIRITHPQAQSGRKSAFGVDFRDGVAEVAELHPERELALKQHGFTVEHEQTVEPVPIVEQEPKASKSRGKKSASATDDEPLALDAEDVESAELAQSPPKSFITDAWAGNVPEIDSKD